MGVTESLSLFSFFWLPVSPKQLLNHLVNVNWSWEGSPVLREIKFLHISEIRGSRADKRHQTLCPHRDKGKKRGLNCICFQRITLEINAINRNLWSGLTFYQARDKNLCVIRGEIRPSKTQGLGEQHHLFSCWQRDVLLWWGVIFTAIQGLLSPPWSLSEPVLLWGCLLSCEGPVLLSQCCLKSTALRVSLKSTPSLQVVGLGDSRRRWQMETFLESQKWGVMEWFRLGWSLMEMQNGNIPRIREVRNCGMV